MSENESFDLQKRLIDFTVRIIKLSEALPDTKVGNHIRGQILRCGTSSAPNYGEAQSAESRDDFIHIVRVVLKELRETKVWLLIIQAAELIMPRERLDPVLKENDELIAIFVASVKTARRNKGKER
jgi:four helix bundle protein